MSTVARCVAASRNLVFNLEGHIFSIRGQIGRKRSKERLHVMWQIASNLGWMCAPKLANKLSLPSCESAAVRNIIITCSKRGREEQLKIGRVWSSFSRQLPRLSQSAIQPASSPSSKRSLKTTYVQDTQKR